MILTKKEECNSSRRRCLPPWNEERCCSRHAGTKAEAAEDHGLLTTHTIKGQGRCETSQHEHDLDAASQNLSGLRILANVFHQEGGDIVNDQIGADLWFVSRYR